MYPIDPACFRRIVLKISGEGFCPAGGSGIDLNRVAYITRQIVSVLSIGRQVIVVIGGGNLVRGSEFQKKGMNRSTADHMGMLSTVINGLALQDELERKCSVETRLMTALKMGEVAEPFIRRRAIRHLEKGRVVLLAGGTGNPYFTTDTTAALRGYELGADVLLKATKVDGVYSDDPNKNSEAVRYDSLTYLDVINNRYRFMDSTAITLCMEYSMPIVIFNLFDDGAVRRLLEGETVGTLITDKVESKLTGV